jgi:hypothetical protein
VGGRHECPGDASALIPRPPLRDMRRRALRPDRDVRPGRRFQRARGCSGSAVGRPGVTCLGRGRAPVLSRPTRPDGVLSGVDVGGHVVAVGRVAFRQDHLGEADRVRHQHLLLEAADRQDAPLQCDFAGEPPVLFTVQPASTSCEAPLDGARSARCKRVPKRAPSPKRSRDADARYCVGLIPSLASAGRARLRSAIDVVEQPDVSRGRTHGQKNLAAQDAHTG